MLSLFIRKKIAPDVDILFIIRLVFKGKPDR